MIEFVLGQKPLNEETWAEYLAGLDSLGAAEWEASAKQALMEAGLLK
jgi:putative aldouronate transport system substrate-binding protein